MEQTSTPSEATDINELGMASKQHKYFWHVRPAEISAWARSHKPELALLTGMTITSFLVSGAAISVLFSPNLGQTLTYEPLIDDETLAASRRISLGEQLLGQVARVLEIEIIETQGPEVGRHSGTAPAMTIVAQADKAAPMPEADLAVGLKAMVLAAGVGLGVTGLIRLIPLIPFSALGPRRRQPLSQRLKPSEVKSQPLAPIISNRPVGPNQALLPGALTSLAIPKAGWSEEAHHSAEPSHAQPIRHPRTSNKMPRTRRKALRHRLVQTTASRKAFVGGLRSSSSASEAAAPAKAMGGEAAVQSPRSHPPKPKPVSFVTLSSVSSVPLIPGQTAPQPRAVLWPNPKSIASTKKSVPSSAPAQFDFLDKLDVRRKYPLEKQS